MQIAQFAKAVFNLSAICKMKKCLFRSTRWSTVIKLCNLCKLHNLQKLFSIWVQSAKWSNVFQISASEDCTVIKLCNLCKLHNLQKLFSIWVQSAKWRNVFSDIRIGVPLSICVICAYCTICKSCFQFEWNLQNEEMSFQIYTLEDPTLINLCNLCKLHNLQKLFSIWVQSAKWRNVFSDLHIGVPLSICIICANCTICKSCFQFEWNLQNEEMSFQIYTLEDRSLINLCNLCKLHNLQKPFSIWLQSAKWRNVFSDLHIGVPLSICIICANCSICKSCFQFECNLQNEEMSFQVYKLEYRYQIV